MKKLIERTTVLYAALYFLLCALVIGTALYHTDEKKGDRAITTAVVQNDVRVDGLNLGVSAASAILMDAKSGAVLFEKNAYTRHAPASTTKIMTALVVLEHLSCDTVVTVPEEAARIEGSSMYLIPNERITVGNLLYGMMLASGNDAAYTLAVKTAGSEEAFAAMMNDKAAELGLKDTHFINPHGLPADGHETTARELAEIARCAMENDVFRTIVSTQSKVVTSEDGETVHYLHNHNKLLCRMDEVTGIKTGYTRDAGRCLVSCAERGESRFIAVTLSAPDDWNDHTRMLSASLDGYETVTLVPKGCRIDFGNRTYKTDNGLYVTLPKGSANDRKLCYTVAETDSGSVSILCRLGNSSVGTVHAASASGDA